MDGFGLAQPTMSPLLRCETSPFLRSLDAAWLTDCNVPLQIKWEFSRQDDVRRIGSFSLKARAKRSVVECTRLCRRNLWMDLEQTLLPRRLCRSSFVRTIQGLTTYLEYLHPSVGRPFRLNNGNCCWLTTLPSDRWRKTWISRGTPAEDTSARTSLA